MKRSRLKSTKGDRRFLVALLEEVNRAYDRGVPMLDALELVTAFRLNSAEPYYTKMIRAHQRIKVLEAQANA